MVANLDADTGPLNFNRNVIISADPVGGCKPGSRVACFPINDPSRLVMTENLEGASADGIVNAVGSLQGAWRTQYLGLRGHELSGSTPPPPPSGSRCDLDVNGSTTITDVQLCVNQAIGVTACTTADIDLSGSCNVVDVQRVVNAALGGSCITQ
jgi:hypothetical protein